QEAADDGTHADVLGNAGQPGAQGTGAADDQVYGDPGARCRIQGLDDGGFGQCVQLGADAGGAPGAGVVGLAADPGQQAAVQGERGLQQVPELDGRPQAGQLLEQLADILAQLRVAAEQADVRVGAGVAGMVVACAQVHVAAQTAILPAHDQHQLGVRL